MRTSVRRGESPGHPAERSARREPDS